MHKLLLVAGVTYCALELLVHALEEVLEQQRQQPARQLQAFIAVVVAVIHQGRVQHGRQHAPHHHRQVLDLRIGRLKYSKFAVERC